jgi:phosphoribosylglycinamide formyltransferase-1
MGFIISTNGSVFKEIFNFVAAEKLNINFNVIVDRDCGAKDFCIENNINHIKIDDKDNKTFSNQAFKWFNEHKVKFVMLYFSRLIFEDLFQKITVFNIHPSFLPSYKGMRAVKDTLLDKAFFQGCTLHLVNENIDDGRILVQNIVGVNENDTLEFRNKLSYLQKILISLILIDYIYNHQFENRCFYFKLLNTKSSINTNPTFLSKIFFDYYKKIQESEDMRVIV